MKPPSIHAAPTWKAGQKFLKGTTCPTCAALLSMILDSRKVEGTVRRRRQCNKGHRYNTKEISYP